MSCQAVPGIEHGYALLFDVLIDICFVFAMYLINLADTNSRYSGFCF